MHMAEWYFASEREKRSLVVIDEGCAIKLVVECLLGDVDGDLKRIYSSSCEVLFLRSFSLVNPNRLSS